MKKLTLSIFIVVCLGGIWYFGHHRPAQETLKAAPKKIYQTTTPITQKSSTVKELSTQNTLEHSDETEIESHTISEDIVISEKTESSTRADVEKPPVVSNENKPAPSEKKTSAHDHPHRESEASKQFNKEEVDAMLAEAENMQKEGHIIVANQLRALTLEEQRITLKRMKSEFINAKHPVTQESLFKNTEQAEAAWKTFFNGILATGYTPPAGAEY